MLKRKAIRPSPSGWMLLWLQLQILKKLKAHRTVADLPGCRHKRKNQPQDSVNGTQRAKGNFCKRYCTCWTPRSRYISVWLHHPSLFEWQCMETQEDSTVERKIFLKPRLELAKNAYWPPTMLLGECSLDSWDRKRSFLAGHINSVLAEERKLSFQREEHNTAVKRNMEAWLCFGVVSLCLARGAMNLSKAQWNPKTIKAILEWNVLPSVRKLCVSRRSWALQQDDDLKHAAKRMAKNKTLDYS